MPNEHVRSSVYAFANMVALVAGLAALMIFMASASANLGFGLTWLTLMLFFPFHYTRPDIWAAVAWTLTVLPWLAVSVAVGALASPKPRVRMALLTLLVVVASGAAIVSLLRFLGYQAPYATVEF